MSVFPYALGMDKARAHVFVSGRVQGVCFRMYTDEEAANLRVRGWVRNLPDGRVEAVFEGERSAVEQMIRWCHKGPPAANVTRVESEWETYHGDLKDFRVL